MITNTTYTHRQAQMVEAYKRLANVWKVADELGVCGQTVHETLTKLGVIRKMNYFTKEDLRFLVQNYPKYRAERRLDELAHIMGRTKQFICRQAKKLGLTDRANRPPMREDERERLSDVRKEQWRIHEHPRGYLGHKHCEEARLKMSSALRANWSDPNSSRNSEVFRQTLSDRMAKNRANGTIKSKSNRPETTITFGEDTYTFKSNWEYEIAIRLEQLKSDRIISDWKYEAERFAFDDCRRGIRSYCPDFKVFTPKGIFYIEVKGWKTDNGMKRLAMFQERYPKIKLYLIDEREYKQVISKADYLRRYTEQIQWI